MGKPSEQPLHFMISEAGVSDEIVSAMAICVTNNDGHSWFAQSEGFRNLMRQSARKFLTAYLALTTPAHVPTPSSVRVRNALADLVGSHDVEQLRGIAAQLESLPAPDEDKDAMLNAITVLIETAPDSEAAQEVSHG